MTCNEHHIICKAVGDGWICTACETRYMPMSEHEAKVAEEIAKWKGIVKGVHGALNDIGTVTVPAMDADLYDAVMSIHGALNDKGQSALSALDQLEAQQQPKRLTDEEIERYSMMYTVPFRYELARALRYARDSGYLGGLSVDDAVKVAYDWFEGPVDNGPGSDYDKLRARLTAKLQGK